MRKITAIVPIYTDLKNSIRENFILLDSKPLFSYIFETLIENTFIDEVICYSSNSAIKGFLPKQVKFIKRNRKLDEDNIRFQDMLGSISKDIISDFYILCSITSPFISNTSIIKGIQDILSGEFDCAFSVRKINTYAWFENKPLNFSLEKILKTNEIEPLFIETKGFYIFSRQILLTNSYVGKKISQIEVDAYEAINIKTKQDIQIANTYIHNKSKIDDKYFLLSKVCSHIIFDMDGVLIDSINLMQKAWKFSGGEKYAPFDEYKKYIGIPFVQICEKLGIKNEKIQNIKKKYFAYSRQNIQDITLCKNVKSTLKKLRKEKVKLSVVTSKDYQAAYDILTYFKLEIDCLIAPNSPFYQGRDKPFGDPLLHSCVLTHTSINQTLFIGDMLSDYQAAKNANIDFIFANYGYGKIDLSVNSIQNIKEILLLIS